MLALNAGRLEIARLAAANPGAAVVFRVDVGRGGQGPDRSRSSLDADVITVAAADPERPRFGTATEPNLPERGQVIVRLAGAPAASAAGAGRAGGAGAKPAGRPVQAPRTIALALAGLPGWSRRAAYDFVLSVQG